MLFSNTSDIKKYVPVNVSLEYDTIKPFLTAVERDFLKRLIGSTLYAEILDYTQNSSAIQKGLLDLCRQAVINLALWKWTSGGAVNISDIGITRPESEKQKSAYKYQEDALRDHLKEEGFNSLDAVLEYLEDNIDSFSSFKASDNYTIFKSNFINQTSEFDDICSIGASRLVFLKLRRFMTLVEDFEVLPAIGKEMFDKLKAFVTDTGSGSGSGDPDEHSSTVITYLKKAIAHLSIARGILDLNVNITDKGFFFESKEGSTNSFNRQSNLSTGQLSAMANNAKKTGNDYLEHAIKYMRANIESFTDYEDSAAYGSGDGTEGMNFDNTDKKIIRV